MTTPQDLWATLANAPGLALGAGVTDDSQFAKLQEITGLALPAAAQAAYQRHNGQAQGGKPLFNSSYRWLSLGEVVREWRGWQALMLEEAMAQMQNTHEECGSEDEPVRLDWWNARWLPLASDVFGNLLCIDHQPTRSGTKGQIIEVFHDEESRQLVAVSFEQLLADAVADAVADVAGDVAGDV